MIDSVGGAEMTRLMDILCIQALPTILELSKETLADREFALVVEDITIE